MSYVEGMNGSFGNAPTGSASGMGGSAVAGADCAAAFRMDADPGMSGPAGADFAADGAGGLDMVPEMPEGYALPKSWAREGVPEDLAAQVTQALEGDREEFMRVCHACRLTDSQATALYGSLGGVLAEAIARDNAAFQQSAKEAVTGLWPGETAENLAIARRGAQFLKLGDALDKEGLSAHPLVLRMAHAVGRMIGEDAMRAGGVGGAALPAGEAARSAMHTIIASDAYRRNDPAAIRKVEALAARVSRAR